MADSNNSASTQLSLLYEGKKRNFEKAFQNEIVKQFGEISTFGARKIIKLMTTGIATLHIAIETNDDKQIVATLNNSADFITKNAKDHIAVQQHIKKDELHYYRMGCEPQEFYALYKYRRKVRKINNFMLFAHVKCHNVANSSSKYLYDFRVACMFTNAESIKALWNNQVFPIKIVNVDLKILSGYPTLHFAVSHSNLDAAKALVDRGVEVNSKNAKGQTPLDILVAGCMEIIDFIRMGKKGPYKKLVATLDRMKYIILMILEVMSNAEKIVVRSSTNLKNESFFNKNLWIEIRKALWQGCTPLPFSLYININIGPAQNEKSNEGTKETKVSVVSLSSFMKECPFYENLSIWKNIRFSDNKTNLAEFHAAMKDSQSFRNLMKKIDNNISMIIPHDSPVLPGCTPLHLAIIFAAKMDYDNIVRTTFDINKYKYFGLSRYAYINMVKHCLELGADITVPDTRGTTPLQLAEKLLGERVVKLLQEFRGAEPDSTKKSKLHQNHLTKSHPAVHEKVVNLRTHLATISYNTTELQTTMDKLHKKHAKSFYQVIEEFASKKNCGNVTPLHAACCKLDLVGVQKCLAFEDVNVRTRSTNAFWAGFTPLHFLTMKRDTFDMDKLISIARVLLEKGADVTLKNTYEFTPLHQTLDNIFVPLPAHKDKKRIEFLNMLLNGHSDTNVNPTDPRGISHFHIACICNQVDLVENFVKNGVDVNKKINDDSNIFIGFSPLHLAASYKNNETVNLLLKLGADIHARNHLNNTPLHEAANYLRHSARFRYVEKGDEVVQTLVSAGSDIAADNSFGQIPLEILMETKTLTKETFKILLKDPSCVNIFNRISGVGLIGVSMMYMYDVNTLDNNLVYKAAIYNPNKNKADANGRTPIHNIAAMRNYSNQFIILKLPPCDVLKPVINNFIKLGHQVDQQDNEGQTALHIAAKFLHVPAIETLLSLGSDINITDINGRTPPLRCLKICRTDIEYKLSDKSLKQISMYKKQCLNAFFKQIEKMKLNGNQINNINEDVYFQLQNEMVIDDELVEETENNELLDCCI